MEKINITCNAPWNRILYFHKRIARLSLYYVGPRWLVRPWGTHTKRFKLRMEELGYPKEYREHNNWKLCIRSFKYDALVMFEDHNDYNEEEW